MKLSFENLNQMDIEKAILLLELGSNIDLKKIGVAYRLKKKQIEPGLNDPVEKIRILYRQKLDEIEEAYTVLKMYYDPVLNPEIQNNGNRAGVNNEGSSGTNRHSGLFTIKRLALILVPLLFIGVFIYLVLIYRENRKTNENYQYYISKADSNYQAKYFSRALLYYDTAAGFKSIVGELPKINNAKKSILLSESLKMEADNALKQANYPLAFQLADSADQNNHGDPHLRDIKSKQNWFKDIHSTLYKLSGEQAENVRRNNWDGDFCNCIGLYSFQFYYGLLFVDFIGNNIFHRKIKFKHDYEGEGYNTFNAYYSQYPQDISVLSEFIKLPIYNPTIKQDGEIKEGIYYGRIQRGFGHYNPEMINWITDYLVPMPGDSEPNGLLYKEIYKVILLNSGRIMTDALLFFVERGKNYYLYEQNTYQIGRAHV